MRKQLAKKSTGGKNVPQVSVQKARKSTGGQPMVTAEPEPEPEPVTSTVESQPQPEPQKRGPKTKVTARKSTRPRSPDESKELLVPVQPDDVQHFILDEAPAIVIKPSLSSPEAEEVSFIVKPGF